MKITCLVENTSRRHELGCEHGLSLFVESCGKRILFDMGAGALFLENARKIGVEVEKADIGVLSHGHSDHGGGLGAFLALNPTAKVYVRGEAFGDFYSERPDGTKYIGLLKKFREHPQIALTGGQETDLGRGIQLFSVTTEKWDTPKSNGNLKELQNGAMVPDRFLHEQDMIVKENGTIVLFAGCAHRGILNILDRCVCICKRAPDVVVGGFHLHSPAAGAVDPKYINELAVGLMKYPSRYYTCHCTGHEAFLSLNAVMGGRIDEIRAGDVLNI